MKTFLKIWVGIGLIAIGAGIAVIIIAMTTNLSSWRDIPTFSMNESYEDIQSLDFHIGYGKVIIEEGDTFSINGKNVPEEGFESYVKDGTWYIRESFDDMIDVLGLRFSMRQVFRWNEYGSPRITITVPEGFSAETYRIKVGAGDVTVESVHAKEGDFTVDAGVLRINELSISDSSSYEVGAGEMNIKDLSANETRIKCGVGYIKIDGTLTGDNDIDCGVGSIELDLEGSREDYSYDVSTGVGAVRIDGRQYHGRSRNNNTENEFKLHCSVGRITVDFH